MTPEELTAQLTELKARVDQLSFYLGLLQAQVARHEDHLHAEVSAGRLEPHFTPVT